MPDDKKARLGVIDDTIGTVRHGILVDVARKEIAPPAAIGYRWMTARLVVVTDQGTKHTLVVNKVAARDILFAVNRSATA